MKKTRNIMLIALAASLLVGCSKQGIISSEPTSEPSSSEPAPAPEPEPAPVPEDEYDVTGPIDDPGVIPLDEDEFELFLNELTGLDYTGRILKEYLGEGRFRALMNCSHFKEERVQQFGTVIALLASLVTSEKPELDQVANLFLTVADLNVDEMVATLREIVDNKEALSFVAVLSRFNHQPLKGDLADYQLASKYFNDEKVDLKAAADFEKIMSEEFPLLLEESSVFTEALELVKDNGILGALRFVKHIGSSAKKHLSRDEFKFLIASIAGETWTDEQQRYMGQFFVDTESIKNLISHAGTFITNMNMSVDSWAFVLPSIEKIALLSATSDYRSTSPEIYSNFTALQTVVRSVTSALKPLAVRSLIKFFGLLGENVEERVIDCFYNNPVDEHGVPAIPLTAVSNYYNRMFGLLTEEEKTNLDDAFFAFGVDLGQFNSDLDVVAETNDLEAMMGLVQSTFAAVGARFDVRTEYYDRKDGQPLIFKQGDTINQANFVQILKSKDMFRVRAKDNSSAEEDVEKRQVTLITPIDTSTPGTKELRFRMSYEVDWMDGENPRQETGSYEFLMTYFVVPTDVEYLVNYLNVTTEYQGSYIGERPITDDQGKKIMTYGNRRLVLEKGAHYGEGELTARVAPSDIYFYSADQGRYLSSSSEFIESSAEFCLDFSTQNENLNTIGSHYAYGTYTVTMKNSSKIVFPVYVAYDVVNKISAVDDGDAYHIELD